MAYYNLDNFDYEEFLSDSDNNEEKEQEKEFEEYYNNIENIYNKINNYISETGNTSLLMTHTQTDLMKFIENEEFTNINNSKIKRDDIPVQYVNSELIHEIQPDYKDGWVTLGKEKIIKEEEIKEKKVEDKDKKQIDKYNWTISKKLRGIKKKRKLKNINKRKRRGYKKIKNQKIIRPTGFRVNKSKPIKM